jgi:hypothetical protein
MNIIYEEDRMSILKQTLFLNVSISTTYNKIAKPSQKEGCKASQEFTNHSWPGCNIRACHNKPEYTYKILRQCGGATWPKL